MGGAAEILAGGPARPLAALPGRLLAAVAAAEGRLFPFLPVCLAVGIGGYFALPVEPPPAAFAAAALAAGALLLLRPQLPEGAGPLAAAAALLLLGFLAAALRTHLVAAPVLGARFHGTIEGRIVAIDRSLSDVLRLTLDQVVLEGIAPGATPARVRVALHGGAGAGLRPEPGQRVILTGHLSPPEAPAEPGGFDFRRHAWFERLGAVGYTRSPVHVLAPPEGPALAITRLRMAISEAVRAALPGEAGAFAAAVLTGDRSGVGRATLDDLRESNLAHLLAISGLHMGLLTAFVFALLRAGLALVPPLALRLPGKKIAAAVALAAAAFYLALSGGNVATERAFVMVAVMLAAVLLDRRAISLRSVAIAATILLLLEPQVLLSAGFQMSFAATVALVAAFSALAERQRARGRPPGWAGPVISLVLSSAVAGLATAPIAAAHFGRLADYGLLANILAVPAMGTLVIPGAVLAGILAPLGLEGAGLLAMELGARWILGVAAVVADLPGAVTPVVRPPAVVLPMLALGALWALLWPGRARLAGAIPCAVALALWAGAERPFLLVSPGGGLLGVMTPEGRALSKPTGEGFVARSWLEADGDAAGPAVAAARAGFVTGLPGMGRDDRALRIGETEVILLAGRGAAERLEAACRPGRIVVTALAVPRAQRPCLLLDARRLAATGAVAIDPGPGGPVLRAAKAEAGRRPWTARPPRAPRAPAEPAREVPPQ